MTNDFLALIVPCEDQRSCYLNVDDFHDPDEVEISSEEIHVTVVMSQTPQDTPYCFRLSTTSAKTLINELTAAIARRKGGEPWDR
jgi:hypothetical protein